MKTISRTTAYAVFAVLSLTSLTAIAQSQGPIGVPIPPEIIDPPWLEARQQAQLATAGEFESNIDFSFTDKLDESWIRFRNRVTEDAAITYKAVHYDHGNGIAVADIDGDGRLDIYFVNQVGANELWRNIGGGRFIDITEIAGVGMADRISVTASFADIDNDGDPDLYVTSVREGNQLFENLGEGNFKDISAASGLNHKGHSSGALFFDYDRDGLLDLYLTNPGKYTSEEQREGTHEGVVYKFYDGFADAFSNYQDKSRIETNRLFKNKGNNTFEDVSKIMKGVVTGWSGDATTIDINEDGWPDIFELQMQGHDQYYENQGGKSFKLKSRKHFPRTSWGSMGVKVFDWNNDGDMDIYITDMHSDMSHVVPQADEDKKSDMKWDEEHLQSGGNSIFGNSFFDNQGDGKFTEISDQIGAENFWPWGFSVADINADGFQDIFVTASMNYPFRYQTNFVLINEGGKRLRKAEFLLGVEPRKHRRTSRPWFYLDCAENGMPGHSLCRGLENEKLNVWSALGSRYSAIFDLDDDGDLDIVTNEFNSQPMILISDLAQRQEDLAFLKVSLIGSTSNRSGIGARVEVTADGNRYTQVLDGKSGYLSQSLMPLYFGLGEAKKIDSITIHWPSGKTQSIASKVVEQIELQTTIAISEPD